MPALTATLLWRTLNNLITAVSSQSLQNPNRPRSNYIECLLAPCHFFSQYHAKSIEATEEEITSLGTCGRFQDGLPFKDDENILQLASFGNVRLRKPVSS
jgi:hypothetical protein